MGSGRDAGHAMTRDDRSRFAVRSFKALQRNIGLAQPAIAASYTLVGAVVLCGGLGYVLDSRYDTAPWLATSGLAVGLTAGLYQLAKAMWRR